MVWFVLLTLIQWIAIYPVDSAIQLFEQLGPGHQGSVVQRVDYTIRKIVIQWKIIKLLLLSVADPDFACPASFKLPSALLLFFFLTQKREDGSPGLHP